MKTTKLFLSICLLLVFLCACGTAKEATYEQMATDLFSCDAFQAFRYTNPMEIESLEVEKRQTHAEDGIDTVWVKVAAQNDSVSGIMHYIMTYGLYNDGWRLDKVEENRTETWSFTPTKGPSEELIAQWLPDGAEIIDDTLWLEDGQENITYSYAESHSYCKTVREECMTFTFDSTNTGLWSMFNTVTLSEETTWDVCGQYNLYNNGSKANDEVVTIYEFSPDRIVWQVDSQPDYLREYDLVDVSSYSITDYYMNYAGYSSDRERALRYGYTFTIDNVDWSEIQYASTGIANIFIGQNHIYAFDDDEMRKDAEREIPYTLRYELIPIGE